MPDVELELEAGCSVSISAMLREARPLVLMSDRSAADRAVRAAAHARVEHVNPGDEPGSGVTVVRPDGYVGFRGGPQHRAQLQAYVRLIGL